MLGKLRDRVLHFKLYGCIDSRMLVLIKKIF